MLPSKLAYSSKCVITHLPIGKDHYQAIGLYALGQPHPVGTMVLHTHKWYIIGATHSYCLHVSMSAGGQVTNTEAHINGKCNLLDGCTVHGCIVTSLPS